jgi:hypothetical protein
MELCANSLEHLLRMKFIWSHALAFVIAAHHCIRHAAVLYTHILGYSGISSAAVDSHGTDLRNHKRYYIL